MKYQSLSNHPRKLFEYLQDFEFEGNEFELKDYADLFGYDSEDEKKKWFLIGRFKRFLKELKSFGFVEGDLIESDPQNPVFKIQQLNEETEHEVRRQLMKRVDHKLLRYIQSVPHLDTIPEDLLSRMKADIQIMSEKDDIIYRYKNFGLREGFENSSEFPEDYQFNPEGVASFYYGIVKLADEFDIEGYFQIFDHKNRATELVFEVYKCGEEFFDNPEKVFEPKTGHVYSKRQFGIIKALQQLRKNEGASFQVPESRLQEIANGYLLSKGVIDKGMVTGQPTTRALTLLEAHNQIRQLMPKTGRNRVVRTFKSLMDIDTDEGLQKLAEGAKVGDSYIPSKDQTGMLQVSTDKTIDDLPAKIEDETTDGVVEFFERFGVPEEEENNREANEVFSNLLGFINKNGVGLDEKTFDLFKRLCFEGKYDEAFKGVVVMFDKCDDSPHVSEVAEVFGYDMNQAIELLSPLFGDVIDANKIF